jgi:5-methylcytosine-specific restriction endonuclease McrA
MINYIVNEEKFDFSDIDISIRNIIKNRYKMAYVRTRLAEAQNWKCCYCYCEMNGIPDHKRSVTIEHVTPKSLGGTDDETNLAAACKRCNNARGNGVISTIKWQDKYVRRWNILKQKGVDLNVWLDSMGIKNTKKIELITYIGNL